MSKVTVVPPAGRTQTPTEEVLDEATKIVTVTDALGRRLEIRRIDTSIRRRVFKVLSAESQAKEQYLGLVMVAASVASIDGEDIRFPSNELRFDALIDLLDDEGLNAASKALREHFMPNSEMIDEAKN